MTNESTSGEPTPIIICGKHEAVGAGVIEGLKPEYEVVQFISNPEACIAEIPDILRGKRPVTSSSQLGTGSISPDRRPVAIVLGGGYAETFDQVHDGVEAAFPLSGSGVAWLRHDGTKPAPPPGPEYGQAVMKRTRDTLAGLREDGKLGSGETGVYWF